MATLTNLTDDDVFCAALHVMVPARGSVEIDDAAADRVNTVSGVLSVARAEASRRQVTRGGKRAEVSAAPPMETR